MIGVRGERIVTEQKEFVLTPWNRQDRTTLRWLRKRLIYVQKLLEKVMGDLTNNQVAHHQHHSLEPMGLAILQKGQ